MKKWTAATAAVGVTALGMAAGGPVRAQGKFPDIPPGHWAFQAVEDLADAGLVLGYPDGKFLGNRSLTRYEMATLVKRIVDNLAQRTPPTGVTPEQLAEVRRLVDELKVELAVIGTDMAAVKTQLESLQGDVTTLKEDVQGLKDVTAGQRTELDTLNDTAKRVRIDGYIQARFTNRATGQARLAPEGTAQDTSRGITGNRDTFQVRRARLNVRGDVTDRASYRFQLDARTAPTAGADEITVKEAYVTVKNFGLQAVPGLGSLVGDGKFFTTMDLTFGQQVTPFGYYLQFSSGDREAPERYIAFSDTGSGLFLNQDYEKGISLNGLLLNRFQYQLGLFNGNGVATNDLGRTKDFIGRIGVGLADNWDIGVSGYNGAGPNTGTNVTVAAPVTVTPGLTVQPPGTTPPVGPVALGIGSDRRRVRSLIGFDTQYYFPFHAALKLEYVRGKGGLNGNNAGAQLPAALRPHVDAATVEGYYAQLSYNLGTSTTLALGYDYFCRNTDPADSGPLSTVAVGGVQQRVSRGNFVEERLQGGVIHFLDTNTRLRLWYEAPLNYPNLPGQSEAGARTGFYTAEVQVKF